MDLEKITNLINHLIIESKNISNEVLKNVTNIGQINLLRTNISETENQIDLLDGLSNLDDDGRTEKKHLTRRATDNIESLEKFLGLIALNNKTQTKLDESETHNRELETMISNYTDDLLKTIEENKPENLSGGQITDEKMNKKLIQLEILYHENIKIKANLVELNKKWKQQWDNNVALVNEVNRLKHFNNSLGQRLQSANILIDQKNDDIEKLKKVTVNPPTNPFENLFKPNPYQAFGGNNFRKQNS